MKKVFFIPAFCIGCLLLCSNAWAQTNATPVAKIASDENALKPTAESATTSKLKKETPEAVAMPVMQRSTAPAQVATTKTPEAIDKDAKSVEIKPGTQKGQVPQNIDRPKVSTIEPAKKTEPAAKPVPMAAPVING